MVESRAPRAGALGAVWIGAAVYAAVYFVLGVDRYVSYHSGSDLGLFTQSIASAFWGFADTPERGNHFTFHFSPILFAVAPLLDAVHSPLVLVAVQAVAGALATPPLFLLARRLVPERLALAIAAVALVYPPLAGVTFTDFHENGFATAATLWLAWAFAAGRLTLAAAFLALALAIKEDQAPILAFVSLVMGAWALRARDRRRAWFAAVAFAAAVAVFVLFFVIVRPLAGAREPWSPTHFYTWSRIVDPRGSAPWYSIGRPAYFLEALVPLCFACLFSPAFVLALPGFVEDLGSHESITYTMGQHYAAVWIPYVLIAYAFGIARLHRRAPRAATWTVRTSLSLCVLVLAVASPTHWGHYLGPRTEHDRALDRVLATLAPDADVGTSDEVFAHLGFDPNAHLGLQTKPRFVLVDEENANSWFVREWHAPLAQRNARLGPYHLLLRDDGVALFERGGAPGPSAERMRDGRSASVARARAAHRRGVARGRRHEQERR